MTTLRIIVGSTASGKERIALGVASRLNAEIISVDSMKVYRRLDVATAKAGVEERRRVPHHCLDLVEPCEDFSVADFVREAERAIADIVARGKVPLLSGGTAFYYKALLEGLFEGPGADLELRASLERRAELEGSEVLHRELAVLDPVAAGKIHPADVRRLVRALEVATLTGGGISSRQTQWEGFHHPDPEERAAAFFSRSRYPFVMVRVVRSREDVHSRVWERIERMSSLGLEAEARWVWENRGEVSRTPLQAVGYKELFPYFEGRSSWGEVLERLRLGTNRLVRSQDTWFRKFPAHEVMLDASSSLEDVSAMIAEGVFAEG